MIMNMPKISIVIGIWLFSQAYQPSYSQEKLSYNTFLIRNSHKPNSELPKHAVASEGQVSLYADYKNAVIGYVPLYIINRTGKDIQIPTEDNDPGIVLYASGEDGKWQRAQHLVHSFCGNSYYSLPLPSDHFYKVYEVFPADGKPCKVRYSRYGFQHSNVGMGTVPEKIIEACKRDADGIRTADIELVKEVLFEEPKARIYLGMSPKEAALRRLGSFDASVAEPVLRKLFLQTKPEDKFYEKVFSA